MRLMLRFAIPASKGNEAAADGTLKSALEGLVDRVQAEAAYFTIENGKRSGLIFFHETDPANLPRINEPMFAALEAELEIVPALTLEDLQKGLG